MSEQELVTEEGRGGRPFTSDGCVRAIYRAGRDIYGGVTTTTTASPLCLSVSAVPCFVGDI